MATHGGPNIVEDGLVFYIDPANKDSYNSGSATETSAFNLLSPIFSGSRETYREFNQSCTNGSMGRY